MSDRKAAPKNDGHLGYTDTLIKKKWGKFNCACKKNYSTSNSLNSLAISEDQSWQMVIERNEKKNYSYRVNKVISVFLVHMVQKPASYDMFKETKLMRDFWGNLELV